MTRAATLVPGDLNRMGRETAMMLATVDSLSDTEMAAPSRCDGWSRAHVVAHLALGADAVTNLVTWALTGEETPSFASREQRDDDLARAARRPPRELKRDLHAANDRLLAAARKLRDGVTVGEVTSLGNATDSYSLIALRTLEVLVHHDDLDTVWTLEEADIDSVGDSLELLVSRLDQDPRTPGLTLLSLEGDRFEIAGGGVPVRGERAPLLGWLARGRTDGVRTDSGAPPDLPSPRMP